MSITPRKFADFTILNPFRKSAFPSLAHGRQSWVPNVLDYLYFTVLTSNTLGLQKIIRQQAKKQSLWWFSTRW